MCVCVWIGEGGEREKKIKNSKPKTGQRNRDRKYCTQQQIGLPDPGVISTISTQR